MTTQSHAEKTASGPEVGATAFAPNTGAEVAGFQPGNSLNIVVTAAVNVGDVVVKGKLVGVSRTTVGASGGTIVVVVEGVFPFAKSTALAVASGDQMKFNTSTKMIDAAGTVILGYAVDDAVATAASVRAKLCPSAA
jgi:predicted RecA/RadA family phage recombinase